MARAGHCSECGRNVWLTNVGACENGHSADLISNIYEAKQVSSSVGAVELQAKKTSLYKRKWFVPTAMLLAGLFVGALLASPSPASTAAPNADLAAQQIQVTTLEAQVDALTAERDELKSEVDSYTAAAEAEAKAVADEAARVAAEEQAAADAAAKAEADAAAAKAQATADAAAKAKATAAAAKTAAASAAAASAKKSSGGGTVYVTRTGEKYHQGGCRYLSQSKIPISLSDARAQGYDACSVCY